MLRYIYSIIFLYSFTHSTLITMGIPSYFVHAIKTYKNIVKPLNSLGKPVSNLYMDCNGIIYDAVRDIKVADIKPTGSITKREMYEAAIMQRVCDTISSYASQVKPRHRVLIAFDGVAPVAKLNQQRERRFRTWITSALEREFAENKDKNKNEANSAAAPTTEEAWSTSCITPGTAFMNNLHDRMMEYVKTTNEFSETGSPTYVLSSSKEPGEGEHKIFEYIRDNSDEHREQVTLVYGLDADLIMLTLNHLHISKNIYLYRETPEFIRSIDSSLRPNEQYCVDIPLMSEIIARFMTNTHVFSDDVAICPVVKKHLVYDYIFMFFMMGNDFMPHFPSMNIRTNGTETVMTAYRTTFQNSLHPDRATDNRSFIAMTPTPNPDPSTESLRVDWSCVREFMQCLAKDEHARLLAEHMLRNRRSRLADSERVVETTASTELHTTGKYGSAHELILAKCKDSTDLLHIPTKERGVEHYIAPEKQGWEQRYYLAMFGERITDRKCQAYCINYLEGLEWTFQYYTRGCIDWRWRYKYAYPPLLEDLVRFIPVDKTTLLLDRQPKDPIRDTEQLRYVLPPALQPALIPNVHPSTLAPPIPFESIHFKWAYCKYFWECHIEL